MDGILPIVGLSAIAFLVARRAGEAKNNVEDRREHAIKLASWADQNSLPIISTIFSRYAIGDYSGVASSVKQAREVLQDPILGQQSVRAFLDTQLTKQLQTADGKEELITLIEKKLNIKINRDAIVKQPVLSTPAEDAAPASEGDN